jgi:hypothetical protein
MLRALQIIATCMLGVVICASPGAWLVAWSEDWSFVSVALIGGLVGLLLALAPVVYRTTLGAALRRVCKGVAWTLLHYNLGDFVDTSGILANEPDANHLIRSDTPPRQPCHDLEYYMWRGSLVGLLLGATGVGFWLVWSNTFAEEPLFMRIMMWFLVTVIAAFTVGIYGIAIAMLFVPGRHRLNLFAAFVVGLLIGTAWIVALMPTAAHPEAGVAYSLLLPTTMCIFVVICSPESYLP